MTKDPKLAQYKQTWTSYFGNLPKSLPRCEIHSFYCESLFPFFFLMEHDTFKTLYNKIFLVTWTQF